MVGIQRPAQTLKDWSEPLTLSFPVRQTNLTSAPPPSADLPADRRGQRQQRVVSHGREPLAGLGVGPTTPSGKPLRDDLPYGNLAHGEHLATTHIAAELPGFREADRTEVLGNGL